MPVQAKSRREFWNRVTRSAAISTFVGVAVVFLICLNRPEFWGWRLTLYGAAVGSLVYGFNHALDSTVGNWIRARHILPDRVVGAPLYFVGGVAGVLAATLALRAAGLMPFRMDARDLRISLLISGIVAIFVGFFFYSYGLLRTRLQASIIRIKEQEFAEKELELAREIQSRLLPPQELSGEGYRISARNLAARFVAGDFYDVFRMSDGALGIAVADVSGKGMGAALIMASVKAVLPLIAEGRRAAETLTHLNRKLHAELSAREFVALAYARFEPDTGVLDLANAGLPDPYLLAAGRAPEPLSAPGPRLPLGARAIVDYESLSMRINPGERLLLLTDGLPEAPMAGGDPLGYELLASLIPRDARTTGDLVDRFFASVRKESVTNLEDDWTALVIEAGPRL